MPELHVIAHDIRSTENVGSIFRTCDSLGISKLWLAGYTPGPEHPKVQKTGLGAQEAVTWEKRIDVEEVIGELKNQGFTVVGLEVDPRAVLLDGFRPAVDKLALLLGNEVEGIPNHLRDVCDALVYIPQKGIKESLNVSVATGIACYELMLKLR